MRMTGVAVATGGLVLVLLAGAAGASRAQEPLDPRIRAYDKGPAKINVSKYPADIQKNYKIFADKCSKCHTLARAVNCEFALEDEWERYVKRMMRKGGSLISPEEGKQIFEFVVYDAKIRKKALYERRLAEAPKSGGS